MYPHARISINTCDRLQRYFGDYYYCFRFFRTISGVKHIFTFNTEQSYSNAKLFGTFNLTYFDIRWTTVVYDQ